MQRQKTQIREKILLAAKAEFAAKGYKGASMRKIAAGAGITPGNIYIYFRDKATLFEAVLKPAVDAVTGLIENCALPIPSADDSCGGSKSSAVAREIAEIFFSYRDEFIILMTKSLDSPRADTRARLTGAIARRLERDFFPLIGYENCHPILAKSIAASVLEGLLSIFTSFDGSTEELREILREYMEAVFRTREGAKTGNIRECAL